MSVFFPTFVTYQVTDQILAANDDNVGMGGTGVWVQN